MAQIRRIGLQKYFGNIAIPELIAAAIGLSIRKHSNDAVFRLKSRIERFRRPQQTYLGLPFRIGIFALPIGVEPQRLRKFPRRCCRKSLRIEVFSHSNRYCHLCIHGCFVFVDPGEFTSHSGSQDSGCQTIHNKKRKAIRGRQFTAVCFFNFSIPSGLALADYLRTRPLRPPECFRPPC